eukprot:3091721-Amphidinium_carterae.2
MQHGIVCDIAEIDFGGFNAALWPKNNPRHIAITHGQHSMVAQVVAPVWGIVIVTLVMLRFRSPYSSH